MDGDGSVLSKLLLGFMHLADEVDESLPGLGNALLRPIRELELSDRPGLAVLQTRNGDQDPRDICQACRRVEARSEETLPAEANR